MLNFNLGAFELGITKLFCNHHNSKTLCNHHNSKTLVYTGDVFISIYRSYLKAAWFVIVRNPATHAQNGIVLYFILMCAHLQVKV